MNQIATRFGQVFWGLLLVILDVTINRFDILPDFIGYILVAVGLGGLTGLSPPVCDSPHLCMGARPRCRH